MKKGAFRLQGSDLWVYKRPLPAKQMGSGLGYLRLRVPPRLAKP